MNSRYGFIGPSIVPLARHIFRLLKERNYRSLHSHWRRVQNIPRQIPGQIRLGKTLIHYADAASLISNWDIIMTHRIYDIGQVQHQPILLDCGANIGLAQLFWKERYGSFSSIAWEPDCKLVTLLKKNLRIWDLSTEVRNVALSNVDKTLTFASTGDDSGHLNTSISDTHRTSIKVKAETLGGFLSRSVDLLKIDIEGAEHAVLHDVRSRLQNVRNIFLEFHLRDQRDRLSDLLAILESAGFEYRIEDYMPHWRRLPFLTLATPSTESMHCGHIYAKKKA